MVHRPFPAPGPRFADPLADREQHADDMIVWQVKELPGVEITQVHRAGVIPHPLRHQHKALSCDTAGTHALVSLQLFPPLVVLAGGLEHEFGHRIRRRTPVTDRVFIPGVLIETEDKPLRHSPRPSPKPVGTPTWGRVRPTGPAASPWQWPCAGMFGDGRAIFRWLLVSAQFSLVSRA